MDKHRTAPDFLLLFLVFGLVGFGILMVYSASSIVSLYKYDDNMYFVKKQLTWAAVGLVGMIIAMNLPYHLYKKKFALIGVLSFFLLALVYTPLGIELNSARSWLGVGSFTIQPAEFAKLGLILYLAALIGRKGERFRHFSQGLLPAIIVSGLFFIMIALQPDVGTAVIILLTAAMVIFVGGARFKHLIGLGIPALIFIIFYIIQADYRVARLITYRNPWNDGMNGLGEGLQLIQSLYAIGHGGATGVGFGKSVQKFFYLPLPQNDFIFSIMAEEIGFVGVSLFILFFLFFLWRILFLTLKIQDVFANLVGIGVVSMISIQALINIGGVTGTIPITGVPLPFISYGGSSLVVNMVSIGVILSISKEAH